MEANTEIPLESINKSLERLTKKGVWAFSGEELDYDADSLTPPSGPISSIQFSQGFTVSIIQYLDTKSPTPGVTLTYHTTFNGPVSIVLTPEDLENFSTATTPEFYESDNDRNIFFTNQIPSTETFQYPPLFDSEAHQPADVSQNKYQLGQDVGIGKIVEMSYTGSEQGWLYTIITDPDVYDPKDHPILTLNEAALDANLDLGRDKLQATIRQLYQRIRDLDGKTDIINTAKPPTIAHPKIWPKD